MLCETKNNYGCMDIRTFQKSSSTKSLTSHLHRLVEGEYHMTLNNLASIIDTVWLSQDNAKRGKLAHFILSSNKLLFGLTYEALSSVLIYCIRISSCQKQKKIMPFYIWKIRTSKNINLKSIVCSPPTQ